MSFYGFTSSLVFSKTFDSYIACACDWNALFRGRLDCLHWYSNFPQIAVRSSHPRRSDSLCLIEGESPVFQPLSVIVETFTFMWLLR
ncbi:hypothetical protein L596_011076 [Steinernema carpocapsae]|uniref:Uncharacterized protein n=1 Tax=Steinernema carpocapsae TaxID=34508 RepID=A0A4U5NT95_STECR|nr:hypothetical protein L596_011076 [Steinernema carpocapsae]